jgi:hypothetical protein
MTIIAYNYEIYFCNLKSTLIIFLISKYIHRYEFVSHQ